MMQCQSRKSLLLAASFGLAFGLLPAQAQDQATPDAAAPAGATNQRPASGEAGAGADGQRPRESAAGGECQAGEAGCPAPAGERKTLRREDRAQQAPAEPDPAGGTDDRPRRQQARDAGETDATDGRTKRQQARDAGETDATDGRTKREQARDAGETDATDSRTKRQQAKDSGDTDATDGQTRRRPERDQAEGDQKDRRPSQAGRTTTDEDTDQATGRAAVDRRSGEDDSRTAERQRRESTGGDVEVTGSIEIERSKASEVRDRLVRQGGETNVDIRVSVGTTIPERVRVRRIPDDIVEIAPAFRGYDYVVVHEEIVIVEPRTKKIVQIIRRANHADEVSRVRLTESQRRLIRREIDRERVRRLDIAVGLGERLPDDVELEPLPEVVFREIPALETYDYVVTDTDIVLVSPDTREVIEVIR